MRPGTKVICTILFFLVVGKAYSQSNNSIVFGKVEDKNGPISYVNIVILSEDSTFIAGTISDESGTFQISEVSYGRKILKASYIGYENKFIDITVNSNKLDLGNIILNDHSLELDEITVTATRPIFRLKQGALTTDVSNSLLSSLGTATDVLSNIPGVSTEDNKVNVFGKGVPLIYINNRRIYDTSELDQLVSSNIQTVEVIRNPGAKYDAENKSVIIIKTKKKHTGLSINVFDRLRVGKYLGNRSLLSIIYDHKNVTFSASYNNSYLKTKTKENSEYTINSDTLWGQFISLPYIYRDIQHDVIGSVEWNISKKHSVGVQYKGTYTSIKNDLDGEETIYANGNYLENLLSKSVKKDTPNTHLINTFYNGKLNDRLNFQFNLDFIKKDANSTQFTQETSDITANSRILNISSYSNFKLFAGKIIGQYSMSEASLLEFGAEYSAIRGKGHYTNKESYLNNNIYTNDEDKLGLFVAYQTNINDYNISLGLRYEHSAEKSTEDSTRLVRVDKKYNNIYPNLNISKTFGRVDLSLNANRRIRRPSFNELNDNNLYINRFTTQKGNPYLKNEDYYEVDLAAQYNFLTFNLGYKYIHNPINIEFQESSNSSSNSILTYKNYNKYQSLSFMGTLNYSIGLWKPRLSIGFIKPFFSTIYKGHNQRRSKEGLSIDITNDFTLPKDFILSLYFNYESSNDDYITRYHNYKQLDFRIRKSFLNKSIITSLYVNDILNIKKESNHSYVENYDFKIRRNRETRYLAFSIQYLFNKPSKRYKGTGATDDLNRL